MSASPAAPPAAVPRPPVRPRRRLSSLGARILAVNMMALVILVVGFLYLDRHQRDLFAAKIEGLTTQGEVIAGALGESVVKGIDEEQLAIDTDAARAMLQRLVVPLGTRARLFERDGTLIADTARLAGLGPLVETRELPSPTTPEWLERLYRVILRVLPPYTRFPPAPADLEQGAPALPEVVRGLEGEESFAIRDAGQEGIIVSVAIPVQHFKHVQGVLLLTTGAADIEGSLRETRFAILEAFGIALGITILISLYISSTIARPVRRLARAADQVRFAHRPETIIPDLSRRNDEIGDLSLALHEMTEALWKRMDAIDAFAADVAHEIKNPLASVRNAIETAGRITDEEQKARLMAIVLEDVERLDRLISDISEASRLDAELSRTETEAVDLAPMIAAIASAEQRARDARGLRIAFEHEDGESYVVPGIESRLSQVFRNLLSNAVTFSPPGGSLRFSLAREDGTITVTLDDEGPGVPPGEESAIFERFYSLRPKDEAFGLHSGLGLSIAKQIVEAHRGTITAENRRDAGGAIRGARFTVRLPTDEPKRGAL